MGERRDGPVGLALDELLDGPAAAVWEAAFARDHVVHVPGLLGADLSSFATELVDRGTWAERRHGDIGVELSLEPGPATGALLQLVNSPALFDLVRRITGCGPIASFFGRIYRMSPSPEHFDRWHNDTGDPARLVGMSVNLSTAPYEGGEFEIRSAGHDGPGLLVPNPSLGDAIIFAIDARYEHRVHSVRGGSPKTALAGWFCSSPPYAAFVRGEVES